MTNREKAEKVPNPAKGLRSLKLSPYCSKKYLQTIVEIRRTQIYFGLRYQQH